MTAIISFLAVLFLSLIVVRVAAVALTLTGMPRDVARFEARSAWTGTGFTTAQSERIVRHPVRRKVVSVLVLLRNAGLVGAVTTLFLSISNIQQSQKEALLIIALLGGMLVLWFLAGNKCIDRVSSRFFAWLLSKYTTVGSPQRTVLLNLGGDYVIQELNVSDDSWLCGKSIEKVNLPKEGILMLGLDREGTDFIGVPAEDIELEEGDNLLLYGASDALDDLSGREAGLKGEQERKQAEKRHEEGQEEEEQEAEEKKND